MTEQQNANILGLYATALTQARLFQALAQDDDYVIHLEYMDPTEKQRGYIRLIAEDMDFNRAELEMFSSANGVSLRVREIECEDGFIYCPELTLWF